MKKIVSIFMLLVLCTFCLVGCNDTNNKGDDDALTRAKNYVYSMYKNESTKTPSDYKRISQVSIDGTIYPIDWTVEIKSGNKDGVKVSAAGEDAMVTITVDKKATEDINYTLTATVKSGEKSLSVHFEHVVPKFEELSWADYIAAKTDESVIVKGTVTGLISKSVNGNTANGLYLQDADGGYYVYSMNDDPGTLGIKKGMQVRVTGVKDIYSGTHEIKNATVEILSDTLTEATPTDYTELFKNATKLTDEKLVEKQAFLVTLKGVEITSFNEDNGYYNFKLGDLTSYIRISSSVCPLTKAEQTTFKSEFNSHIGYIANVTGIISVYNGAFYLTPVSSNAVEYVSLPQLPDAEMVAFEKNALTLSKTLFEDDTTLDLQVLGAAYKDVTITWVSDNPCAVVNNGKLAITCPEEDTEVKLTATLTCGEVTDTKEFTLEVKAAVKEVFVPVFVTSPVVGKAFKLALVQANLGKTLYFSGAMSGNFFATTEKGANAVDVYVETVDGGYKLYFLDGETKKYLDIYEHTEGKVGVRLASEEEASAVYTWNETYNIFVANVAGNDYYLGSYRTFETISASKTSYLTADNVGVSQFVLQLCELKSAQYVREVVTTPTTEGSFKLSLVQANLGKTLYFSGVMSGNFFATTEKAENGVDVYVETVDGGYKLYFLDGETKKYLDIYEHTEGKVGVRLASEEEASAVYTWNETYNIFVANVAGNDYYLGSYRTFETISASKTSYLTADNVGVSQFVLQLTTLKLQAVESKLMETPVTAKAFKVSMYQVNLGKTLYFSGAMSGNFFATTEKAENAVDVYIEEVEGGYKLYFLDGETKKYLDIYEHTEGKAGVRLASEEEASAVYTWNDTYHIFVANVAGNDYYLGSYRTFETISASKTSYLSADNVGVSQFVLQFYSVEVVK